MTVHNHWTKVKSNDSIINKMEKLPLLIHEIIVQAKNDMRIEENRLQQIPHRKQVHDVWMGVWGQSRGQANAEIG